MTGSQAFDDTSDRALIPGLKAMACVTRATPFSAGTVGIIPSDNEASLLVPSGMYAVAAIAVV